MNAAHWWGITHGLAAAGPTLILTLYFKLPRPPLLPADQEQSYISSFQQMTLVDSLLSLLPALGLLLGWVSLAAAVMAWRQRSAGRPVQAIVFGLLFSPTVLLGVVW